MDEFEKHLFSRGYCKLKRGSYRIWISKRWHEMFVRRGLVRKNFYNQYNPNTFTLKEFIKWLELYDKTQHDRDYPKSKPQLTKEEIIEIKQMVM